MPRKARTKLKTHRAAYKRFSFSGGGKLLRRRQMANHLRRNKSARAKRTYSRKVPVAPADARRVAALLPYGAP